MRSDEVRTSENIIKYMKYLGSYDDNNYTVYQFEDESSNVALHYQIKPEFLTDKRQIGLARLFNTKMGKIRVGDICLVVCRCREIHEKQYDNSVFYLNVDKIIKRLVKYEIEQRLYNGVMTDFAIEKPVTKWDEMYT